MSRQQPRSCVSGERIHSLAYSIIARSSLTFRIASTVLADVKEFCPQNADNVCYTVGIPSDSASSGSGNIYFQITAPTDYQWVALGTGSRMSGSNMFIMYQDGNGNLTMSPRLGTFHTPPQLDTSSTAANLELLAGSGVSSDGKTMTANVVCSNCESWDGGSLSLTSSSSNWIGAWRMGDSLSTTDRDESLSQHDDTTQFNLDLTQASISSDANPFVDGGSGGNDTGSGSGSGSGSGTGSGSDSGDGVTVVAGPNGKILAAHGVIMAIVMVVLYPLGSLLMPLLGKWFVHAGWQTVSFLLMWAGFALGVRAALDRDMVSHIPWREIFPVHADTTRRSSSKHTPYSVLSSSACWSFSPRLGCCTTTITPSIRAAAFLATLISGGDGL